MTEKPKAPRNKKRKKLNVDRKSHLLDFKKFKKEIDENFYEDDYAAYLKLQKVRNELNKKINYVKRLKAELDIRVKWKRPKWIDDLKPKKNERRKKVSPYFWAVYAYLWENTISHKNTKELFKKQIEKIMPDQKYYYKIRELGAPIYYYERSSLDYKEEGMPVISIFDAKKVANILGSTENNIGKITRKWEQGPIKKIGVTKPKNRGGKTIYQVGYWTPKRRIQFFTKKNSEQFIRDIMFMPKVVL